MEKTWKPSKRQEDFLSLPDSIFEALYGGAAGGGKSEALIMLPIVRQFYQFERFKGIIFRRTYPELESEIITRSQLWYPHTGAKYTSDKRRWTWPSGAMIQFGHMEYESDARKYDTAEYNYMAFDELTSFTEFQYKYLALSRCRSSSKGLPAIVRAATNPGNIGHAWVRDYFIKPAPFGTLIINKKTGLKRIFIQSKVSDNPYIDPGYESRLAGLPEAERRAKLDGDWWTFEGQVFNDWRENPIPGEPDNACHVIDPFPIPSWWPKFLAIDWGYAAMTIALWGAISPKGRLYVYREYARKQVKISEWATEIAKCSVDEHLEDVVLCRSAWQDRGDELNIAQQFEKFSSLRARSMDGSKGTRVAGKILLQEFLRWRPRPELDPLDPAEYSEDTAVSILRSKGIDAYKEYLGAFEPKPKEGNLPLLQVFNTCPELIKCIPLCTYGKDDNTSGKPAEDVKEFAGDDPYDCVRGLIDMVSQFNIERLKAEGEHRDRVSRVLENFSLNRDQTYLHREMQRLESNRMYQVGPVRRFHSARA